MDIREVGGGMDWTDMAQDRGRCWPVVKTVMNLHMSLHARNCLTS